MMDSKTLLQKLDGGDASNITLEVKAALNGPGCSALAHRLFKRIANLTLMKSKGSPEPVLSNNEETLQLALDCAQAILLDTPCDIMDSISSTIASVQIILYRFSGNKDILLVVKLLNTFLPILKKMSYTFCDKDKKNIQQMKQTVYNLLISLDNNVYKECHDSELSPLYLWDIFLHVNSLTENCQFEFILYCLKSITSKNEKLHLGDADQICAFNRTVIKKLLRYSTTNHWKVDKKGNVNQVFGILVSLLWQLCLPDLKSSNTGNLLSTLTHVSEFVASSFTSHPYHLECFKVISTLVKTFLVPTDAPSKEETFISGVQAILETLENDKVPTHPAISWVGYIAGSALSSMDQVARAMDLKHCLSTRVLSSINNFAQFLSRLLLSSGTTHCTGDDGKACPFQGDAILAFKSVNKFVTLCIDYKKDTEEWSELLPMVKESCDNLNLIVSKASEEGCVKAQLLKSSLSDVQYRVGILCYSTNNWKYGLIFLESQTRQLFALDHQMSSTDAQKLSSVLPRLSVCYENLQLKKKAKLALALGVIVNFKFNLSPSKFMQDKWAKLQNEDGDDITAEKLLRDKILLKTMCPQFSAGNELTLQITVWELSCYAANRMNKTNAILNAWKTLKGLKPSGFQLIEGSALACHALFSCNDLVGWYDVLAVSISEWLLQVKPQQKAAALCSMAAHYHIKFLIMAQEHFDENYTLVEEDVPKTYKFHGAVKKPEDVCNPADVCEIKSSFPNLNLHREQKLMDLLDAAVNYWDNSLESGLSVKDYASSPIVAASGDYLLNIAFFYSLWGHNSGATKAFQVCCTFARKMSIDDLLLQALSGLMNTIQVPEKCILEAENLLEHLKNHPKISYFHMVYNTSRAFQALRTGSFSEGFKALQDVINCPVTSSTIWCYAYAKILQASYQQIPLSKSVQSTNGVHDLVRSGLSRTIQSIQDRRLSQSPLTYAAVVHQALTSALWIGRYFLHRHMPRQARCYLKSELILALKLGLTTRAVEFMCELAMVDLLTENVDEATAKMYDIKSILDVTHIPSEQNCGDITSKDDGVFSQEEVVSNSKYAGTNLGCSPFLEKNEVFRIPILEHSLSCKCYLCSNVSVQIVWLMCGRIQAKINSLRFFVRDSHSTYTQIFKSANVIMKRLSANDPSSGASLQRHQLTRTLIYSKLDLVDMLVIYKKDKEALKENRHIFALLNDLKTDEDNLKLVTEEQQVCIAEMLMKISSKGEDPRTLNKTPDGISSRKASPSTVVDKTPETKGLWVTPVGPGKRRPPLKQVVSPNHLTVPLTDLQFYSPKVSMNLQNVIGRDDDGDDMFPSKLSKENVSRVPHRLINTFDIKPEISGETSVSTCLPNGKEGNKDVKNVTTSKVSNLAQSSKARNVSKVIDNPASSRRRAPKPLPAAEISGETSVSTCLPNGEEGNKNVKNVTTSKVSNLAQSSKARDVSKVIDNPTSSRRRAPKPLPAEGGPLSQRQTLPLAEKAQSSRRKTSNALPNEEKPKSSRREAPTKSKISSVRTDTTSTDASKESMKVSVVRQTRQRKCS